MHVFHRALRLERLEDRRLLTALAGAYEQPSAAWFRDFREGDSIADAVAGPVVSVETIEWNGHSLPVRPGEWLVRLTEEAVLEAGPGGDLQRLLGELPIEPIRGLGLPGLLLVRADAAAADRLAQHPAVRYVEPNFIAEQLAVPNDPFYALQWGLPSINAPAAWNLETGVNRPVVAVIDSGIDYLHSDLVNNIWYNPGEVLNGVDDDANGFTDDWVGYDFIENAPHPYDLHGHGTQAAGVIAAQGNNAIGVAGVNWNAAIMGLKCAETDGSVPTDRTVLAINYASLMRSVYGVPVVATNNSYSKLFAWSQAEFDAISVSRLVGILFVAAAGNSSFNNDLIPSYPADYPLDNIVSVAATTQFGELASFSNYGAFSVALAAPGEGVFTTDRLGLYAAVDGTSFSAPFVTGVAAMLSSYAPNAAYWQIRDAILLGATTTPALLGLVASGRQLNANEAINWIQQLVPPTMFVVGNGYLIADGEQIPVLGDGTDLGSSDVAGGVINQSFQIANDAGSPIYLTGSPIVEIAGPHASDFRVVAEPATPIRMGWETDFTIEFNPSAPGLRSASVLIRHFNSNLPYTFAIQGTGLAPAAPWQNPLNKWDVNNDTRITGLDVLIIINELLRNGPHLLDPPGPGAAPPPYYDVSGDGRITALDALQVVNYINSRPRSMTADGRPGNAVDAAMTPLAMPKPTNTDALFQLDFDDQPLGSKRQKSAAPRPAWTLA